jgi:hypothetical protein
MWKVHDNYMRQLKQLYNKTSKQTQNRLQEIFDIFNFTTENIYNIADNKTKKRINTYIEQWKEQGLLKNNSYFTVLANNIYKRTRVKNSEILELLIYSSYVEEQNKLAEQETQIMYEDANYYYEQGQQEVNKKKKPSILTMALFLALLDQPNYSGFNWKQYIEATIQYNAQQIYKQLILNIQQQKSLEIDSNEFQIIINRQNNQKLNINNGKISGAADLQMIGLNNLAKAEGIKEVTEDNSKVRFIAVEDDKTTLMCDSLNNQEFYINKENVFDRYYGETQKELTVQRIRCNGLVLGLNLPPIQHHFHYCRSTIMYLPNISTVKDSSEDEDLLQYLDINNYIKKDITKQKNILIKQAFKNDMIRNIALNNNIEKIYIYGKKSKHKANNIYLNAEWKRANQNKKNRTIRHEVGHAIDYKHKHISCGGELTTALEIDKSNILKHKEEINKKLRSKEYEEYAELSDIIGGLTNNKIRGKYKHDNEYWKRKNALEKETFADLFAIAGGNDIKYLQVINNYLPNTLSAFDGLIRRIK